ncbi:Hypothetical transmembrane protein [Mycoplasma mycoides subsp. mycoides SC str. PG1]|nr:Hypothetical transmembrane protein [Mycoplasma mycoides subsp. mycoides SC str. PG1]
MIFIKLYKNILTNKEKAMRDYNSSNNQNDRYYQNDNKNNNYHNQYYDNRYDQNQYSDYDDDRYYDQDYRYDQNYQDQNYEQQEYNLQQVEYNNSNSDQQVKFIPDKKIKKIVRFNSIKSFISIFILVGLIGYFTVFLINHYYQFLYDPNNIKQYYKTLQGWLFTMNGFKVWHLSVIIAILSVCCIIYIVVASTLFSNYNKYLKDMQHRTEEYQAQKLCIPYPKKPEQGIPPLLIKKMYEKQIKKPYYAN